MRYIMNFFRIIIFYINSPAISPRFTSKCFIGQHRTQLNSKLPPFVTILNLQEKNSYQLGRIFYISGRKILQTKTNIEIIFSIGRSCRTSG